MEIEKLKQLIEDSLREGSFRLETTLLDSPQISLLSDNYFPDNIIELSAAYRAAVDDLSITIGGKGVTIPFKDMDIHAKFYLLEENAALSMRATGAADWTLAAAIPAFEGTLGASVTFTQQPTPPAFVLLSSAADNMPQGLNFAGTIDFKALSAGVSDLLGITNEYISGPVKLQKGATEFVSIDFTGPRVDNVNLWISRDCSLQLKMGSYVLPNPIVGVGVPVPNIQLETIIPFHTSVDKYELPLSVTIINPGRPVRFNAHITTLIKASLDTFSSFTGGVNLMGAIPSGFDIADYLDLRSLFMDFDLNGKGIQAIGLEVQNAKPWTILQVPATGKTFRIESFFLQFIILTPFNEPQAFLTIGGTLTLTDKASLLLSASYPNFEVSGSLSNGSVLNVREFISQFVGNAGDVPEVLVVEELDFRLQSGDYSFSIELVGFWEINSGQSRLLIVNNLGFSVNYTKEIQTASFAGTITVGNVDLTVTADYKASEAGNGWLFTGQTGKNQLIPIGEFIAYLAETFETGEPPAWIKGITLQDILMRFNTQNKDFEFSVTGNIPIAGNDTLQLIVGFGMKSVPNGYEKKLSGILHVGHSQFTLEFTSSPSDTSIYASWEAADPLGYLQFKDIASAFGFHEFPEIPPGLDLALKDARLYYDFTEGRQALLIAASSANYGNAVFAAKKIDGNWAYVFGIAMKVDIGLEDLPLVGEDIAAVTGKIGLNGFKLIGAVRALSKENTIAINQLISEIAGTEYPRLPVLTDGIRPGVYAAIDLDLGEDNSYEVELNTAGRPASAGFLPAAEPSSKSSNAYWVNLQKAIGPVYFDRAGLSYQDGRVSLLLDASLVFTALRIDMIGLGVSNPLNKIQPAFELSGLNIAYQSGPVQISAGFLKTVTGNITEYSGMAVIGVQAFNLSALGSYASVDGSPSLFIFAMLTSPPLGGPPCFFVTGIAAGFGYNRGLRLPTIDNVSRFPLVMGFVPNQKTPFAGPDPGAALKILVQEDVVPVAIGQNWLAAGVQFTTFQLLQSFALLTAAFGTNLEIGIVGMSTVSVPPKSPVVVAYAQLALAAKLLPDSGVFAVEARLTPASYLLSTSCVLTGGFAFYFWTAPNVNEGDFVVTLGGYHPNFVPPAHYPKVPRLGFNWTVTPQVSLKGGMYFALTPACIMAGGLLEATFSSGNLKAWFIIGADFLIAWKPYHYQAHLYLSFGVSYTFDLDLLFTTITKTITVSLGADMSVWGPEFSGIATIHLYIISFDISFGATPNRPAAAITWNDFKESFLPPSEKTLRHVALSGDTAVVPTDTFCYAKVTGGLVEDLTVKETPDPDISWIVNANQTSFETATIIPAKDYVLQIRDKNGTPIPENNVVYTNRAALDNRNRNFGVGMVNVKNDDFKSKHIVTIEVPGTFNPAVKYEITAVIRSLPKSLWEKRETGYAENGLIQDVLTGFLITPVAPVPDRSLPIDLAYFKFRMYAYAPLIKPAAPQLVPGPPQLDGMKRLRETINSEPVVTVRKNIIDALISRGVKLDPNVNVTGIAAQAEDFIMAPPVLAYTYWKQPGI